MPYSPKPRRILKMFGMALCCTGDLQWWLRIDQKRPAAREVSQVGVWRWPPPFESGRFKVQVDFLPDTTIWVNYNDLTTTSLGIMVHKGNHPHIALIHLTSGRWNIMKYYHLPRTMFYNMFSLIWAWPIPIHTTPLCSVDGQSFANYNLHDVLVPVLHCSQAGLQWTCRRLGATATLRGWSLNDSILPKKLGSEIRYWKESAENMSTETVQLLWVYDNETPSSQRMSQWKSQTSCLRLSELIASWYLIMFHFVPWLKDVPAQVGSPGAAGGPPWAAHAAKRNHHSAALERRRSRGWREFHHGNSQYLGGCGKYSSIWIYMGVVLKPMQGF